MTALPIAPTATNATSTTRPREEDEYADIELSSGCLAGSCIPSNGHPTVHVMADARTAGRSRTVVATVQDQLAVAAILLLGAGYWSALHLPAWGVRAAVLLPVLGAGLVALGTWAARRDPAALLAVGALAIALMSAFASDAPIAAMTGVAGWSTGWAHLASLFAAWAIARRLPPDRTALVFTVLLCGGVANGLVAIAQAAGVTYPMIPQIIDRATGLLGNPVHLGTLSAATATLASTLFVRGRGSWTVLLALGISVVGVQLSGGRIALVAALLCSALAAIGGAPRRCVAALGAVVFALLMGNLISSGPAATTRAGASTGVVGHVVAEPAANPSQPSAMSARLGNWRAGVDAWLDRPVLGWGPGRFAAGGMPRRPVEASLADPGRFIDAHNFVVEYLTTTGVLGLLAIGGWLVVVLREARGPGVWFALALGVVALMQPLQVGMLALLGFALGSAAHRQRGCRDHAWLMLGATAVGIAAAGVLLFGLADLRSMDSQALGRARMLLPLLAETHLVAAREAPGQERIRHARDALAIEPADAEPWALIAAAELELGHLESALDAYGAALERSPHSVALLRARAELASDLGRFDVVATTCATYEQLRPGRACPPPSRS